MQGDSALGRALVLVRTLRAGCAWDHAQTPQTLRPYLVEEVMELDQAIRQGDPIALRDELGDMLLHLAFQIVIAEERSQFNAETVTRGLEQKMRRRHPELFSGSSPAGGARATSDHENWERNKRRERVGGALAGLPSTLPPLLMAYRLGARAAGVGFDWPDEKGPLEKVREEAAEVEKSTKGGSHAEVQDEIGDLLFAVVNLSRKLGVDPGAALEQANTKFTRRFAALEKLASERGVEVGRASLEELDRLWEEIKDTN
jgi:ATP diphosphatase